MSEPLTCARCGASNGQQLMSKFLKDGQEIKIAFQANGTYLLSGPSTGEVAGYLANLAFNQGLTRSTMGSGYVVPASKRALVVAALRISCTEQS